MTAAAHGVLHLRWPWQVIVCLEKAWTLVRLCNVTTGEGLSLKGTSNNINHVQAVACDFSAWILNFFNFWVQWFWQNIWKLNQYHNWDISDLTNRLTGWSWKNNQETTWGDLHQQQLQPNGHLSTLPSLIQAWCVIPAPRRPFRKRLHQSFHVPWSLVGSDTVQLCTTMYNYVQLRMCASLTSHVGCHTPIKFLSGFFMFFHHPEFFILQIHPLSTQGGLSGKQSTIHVSQESIWLTSFTQHTTLQYIIVFICFSSFLLLAVSPLFR